MSCMRSAGLHRNSLLFCDTCCDHGCHDDTESVLSVLARDISLDTIMDSIDCSQIPVLIGRSQRRRREGAEEHPRRRRFRAGGRGGGCLTRDRLAKWPERATLMLIDVTLVAIRCF